ASFVSYSAPERTQRLLTKGDNNGIDDSALYERLEHLETRYVVEKVRGILPMVGEVSIFLNEFPRFRYAVFGAIGLFNLFPS
ncbi:hypothetical protein C8J57DRAFT_1082657, partial [Mycena rebaudengoi]